MNERADLLVIGGGITGQAAALTAAKMGARVGIVDFGRNAGSHANAGSLHVQMQSRFLRLNPHLAQNLENSLPLYRAGVTAWERLAPELGEIELTRDGGLMLAETSTQMAFLEGKAARERLKGLSVDILDKAALRKIAPYLGGGIVGGEICHDEGKLNPLLANSAMEVRLREHGVTRRSDFIRSIEDGPKPAALGERRHEADRILIAAAWGAGALCEPLGLPLQTPAEPLHMNITEAGAYVIRHLVQHAERSITLKQFHSGQVVIGGGWPARAGKDHSVPGVHLESMLGNVRLAARMAPGIGSLRVLRTWAGYNTPIDGKATIGALRDGSRIFLALPGDAGYTLGPIVGETGANLALGVAPVIDPLPFSPDRWRN